MSDVSNKFAPRLKRCFIYGLIVLMSKIKDLLTHKIRYWVQTGIDRTHIITIHIILSYIANIIKASSHL